MRKAFNRLIHADDDGDGLQVGCVRLSKAQLQELVDFLRDKKRKTTKIGRAGFGKRDRKLFACSDYKEDIFERNHIFNCESSGPYTSHVVRFLVKKGYAV